MSTKNELAHEITRRLSTLGKKTKKIEIGEKMPGGWRVRAVDMEVATHTGKRLKMRGKCEKCDTPTNWVVDIPGRVGAFWCGCGNSL